MKIALMVMNLGVGGAQRAMVMLARELSSRGLTVDILAAEDRGQYKRALPPDVAVIPLGRNPITMARNIVDYAARNRDARFLSAQQRISIVTALLRRLGIISNAFFIREPNAMRAGATGRLALLWWFALRLGYSAADGYVAVTEHIAEELTQRFPTVSERITVISNAVDLDFIAEQMRENTNHAFLWPERAVPVLLAAGRLAEQKGFDTLIEAFARARETRPLKLIILGEGKLRDPLEAQVRALGLCQDVALPGFVDNPYAYMAAADLFVLSSRFEGSPNVVLEALACGCPVVATDCPTGPREILADTECGHLTPVDDACALSRAILSALDSPVDRSECKLLIEARHAVGPWSDRYLAVLDADTGQIRE